MLARGKGTISKEAGNRSWVRGPIDSKKTPRSMTSEKAVLLVG